MAITFTTRWLRGTNYVDDGPVEVNDENILPDKILPQAENCTSLTAGLNVLVRLYHIALETRQLSQSFAECKDQGSFSQSDQQHLDLLKTSFYKQKHALDVVPEEFKDWDVQKKEHVSDPLAARQFEIMRANIRVTHLWLQSLVFEDIVSLSTDPAKSRSFGSMADLETLWGERESICRELLLVLYNISHANLEPNGASLVSCALFRSFKSPLSHPSLFRQVHKIRVVAATLIDCPFEMQGSIARQAYSYIKAFASVLASLDGNVAVWESWSSLDRHERRPVSEFCLESQGG